MSQSLKRKPVGTPTNTPKKQPSTTADETAVYDYDEQPWATAHLRQQAYGPKPTTGTTTMPPRPSSKAPTPPKSDSVNDTTQDHEAVTTAAATTATAEEEDTDAITPLPHRQVYIDPIAGHSNVTIPARPTRKHTYSECFDLDDLAPGTQVRSPSGNMLSAEQAAVRADRPVGIRERQEIIRRKVAEQRAKGFGNEVTVVGDVKGKEERERAEREQRENGGRAKRGRFQAKTRNLAEKCRCQ